MKPAVCALLATAILQAQPAAPPVQPGVEGQVINSINGQPVRKATVVLRAQSAAATSYAAESDSNGHFAIENIEPGDYSISADRQGYWLQTPGATGAPPPSIKVEKEQQVTGVVVRLTPLGVVTGRVLDPDGDPVRGAFVESLRYVYQMGKKELQPAIGAMSNDNGEYRLFGLRAGPLYVRASGAPNRFQSAAFGLGQKPGLYAPTFFPSVTDPGRAVAVDLAPGAQVAGIDIRLRTDAAYSVRVKMPESANNFNVRIEARSAERRRGFEEMVDNGMLVFPNLLPGSYVVTALRDEDGKRMVARAFVDVVDADVEVGALNFSPVGDVSGRVRIEGKPIAFEELNVSLQADGTGVGAMVKSDGTFVLREVVPDVYRVTVRTIPGTYLKSVLLEDKELPDLRLDLRERTGKLSIVLGSDVGEVEGSVVKANGDPAIRVRVTLIAYGKLLGRGDLSRSGFTDDKGKFHLRNVAPGEYKIFAWEDVPVGAPQDPAFRKPYEKQSASIKMEPNGHASADLTAISLAK